MDAYEKLSASQLRAALRERDAQIVELNKKLNQAFKEINSLKHLLEQQQRQNKRQAAPFAKNPPKENPKKNGRKAGQQHGQHAHRQPPDPTQINETYIVELPNACPHCGEQHSIEQTGIDHQYQEELPKSVIKRQFTIHVGKCKKCGRRVRSRHPLQTSDATGAAASQVGPNAQAFMVNLNKTAGLSHGKVAAVMQSIGLNITRGASAQIVLRTAKRLRSTYEQIKTHIASSPRVCADETGWRVNGRSSWLHGFVTEQVTCYHIDICRGSNGSKQVLPLDYEGKLTRDGLKSYDRYSLAAHQQCLSHLLERCKKLIELCKARDRPGSSKFARQVKQLLKSALKLRDDQRENKLTQQVYVHRRAELQTELEGLVQHCKRDADNERFARFLYDRSDEVLLFLWDEKLDATNWRAEQAMRVAVVNRKVWGGNRTWIGAEAQSVLSSVLRTLGQQSMDVLTFVSSVLRGMSPTLSLS